MTINEISAKIESLDITPNTVAIVLQCDGRLHNEAKRHFAESMRAAMEQSKVDVPIVVLDEGVRLCAVERATESVDNTKCPRCSERTIDVTDLSDKLDDGCRVFYCEPCHHKFTA